MTPASATQGVGGAVTLTIAVLDDTPSIGTGRPMSLHVTTSSDVLAPIAPATIQPKQPGEVTYGIDSVNTFLPSGVALSFDVKARCVKVGTAQVLAKEGNVKAVAEITCTNDPVEASAPHPARDFSNGIGEILRLGRSGANYTFTAGGVTSNLNERTPEVWQKFSDIGPNCEKFEGVADFKSLKGPATFTANTGAQQGTATYQDATLKYTWSGLQAGALFPLGTDTTFTYSSETLTVTPPPAFGTPSETLSPPAGLDTSFYVPPTNVDFVIIFGLLSNFGGFSCLFQPPFNVPIENGMLKFPIVPADVRAAYADLNTRLQDIYLGKANGKATTTLFPQAGARNVLAARFVHGKPADFN